jgi:hypothetical protein
MQSFQPHYGPEIDSVSARNEYQEPSWLEKDGWRVRPSANRFSKENVGVLTSHNPMGLYCLLQG